MLKKNPFLIFCLKITVLSVLMSTIVYFGYSSFVSLRNSNQLTVFWLSISTFINSISVLLSFFLMKNVINENQTQRRHRKIADLRSKMNILLSKYKDIDKTSVKALARYSHYVIIDLYEEVEQTKDKTTKLEFVTHSVLKDLMHIADYHFFKQGELYDKIYDISMKKKNDFKSLFVKFLDILTCLDLLKLEYISRNRISSIGNDYIDRYINNFLNLFRNRIPDEEHLTKYLDKNKCTISYFVHDAKKVVSFKSSEFTEEESIENIFNIFKQIKSLSDEEYRCMTFPYSSVWKDIIENKLEIKHCLYIYDIYEKCKTINEYKKEFGLV